MTYYDLAKLGRGPSFLANHHLVTVVLIVMPFGEIVVGSPGSGKSTYCYGKHQLFTALNRPISIVNLDPANDNIPYPCAIDIASLITLQDVMSEHGLGPNGGMLFCMEYLEANYDWLADRLGELGKEAYVLFDLPGQVELSTNHNSLKRIIEKLGKSGFRVCDSNLRSRTTGSSMVGWFSWPQCIYAIRIMLLMRRSISHCCSYR
jgi:GTPase SAR1 family protein